MGLGIWDAAHRKVVWPHGAWRDASGYSAAMSTLDFDPDWLAQLRLATQQAPRQPRLPLLWGDQVIGSVEPGLLRGAPGDPVHAALSALAGTCLVDADSHWRLVGDATEALRQIALALRGIAATQVDRQWRNENLAIWDSDEHEIAQVERGAARALGITTRAVHLIGHVSGQRMWIQQRAWTKATEPGLWDTLMGGMVSAADTVASALQRETWEEAGLQLEQLQHVRYGGQFTVQKPNGADGGVGYMVEQTHWYDAIVPDGIIPENQDGEVAQFALVTHGELLGLLHDNAFTTEAATALVLCLGS